VSTTWETVRHSRSVARDRSAYGSSDGRSNQYGMAVATGDKGGVVYCEYVTTMVAHGSGACVDSHGTLYNLIF